MENTLLKKILSNHGKPFTLIKNRDGKYWIMPKQNMRMAMQLYQPSGIKGKLLKRLYPYLKNLRIINNLIKVEDMRCRLTDDIHSLISKSLKSQEFEFAIFGGTPGSRQKITIQIFSGHKILGYCKISESQIIAESFKHESFNLNYLHSLDFNFVPNSIYCNNGSFGYIFIQDTNKTLRSSESHSLTHLHFSFLENLYQKTKLSINFFETDFYKAIEYYKKHDSLISDSNAAIINNGISETIRNYKDCNEFYFFHGDFTPWNTYIEDNMLYSFDLEYSQISYPKYIDLIHYFLQVEILEHNKTIFEIENDIKSLKKYNNVFELRKTLIAYLVHIILFYTRLFGNMIPENDRCFPIWLHLLNSFTKQ